MNPYSVNTTFFGDIVKSIHKSDIQEYDIKVTSAIKNLTDNNIEHPDVKWIFDQLEINSKLIPITNITDKPEVVSKINKLDSAYVTNYPQHEMGQDFITKSTAFYHEKRVPLYKVVQSLDPEIVSFKDEIFSLQDFNNITWAIVKLYKSNQIDLLKQHTKKLIEGLSYLAVVYRTYPNDQLRMLSLFNELYDLLFPTLFAISNARNVPIPVVEDIKTDYLDQLHSNRDTLSLPKATRVYLEHMISGPQIPAEPHDTILTNMDMGESGAILRLHHYVIDLYRRFIIEVRDRHVVHFNNVKTIVNNQDILNKILYIDLPIAELSQYLSDEAVEELRDDASPPGYGVKVETILRLLARNDTFHMLTSNEPKYRVIFDTIDQIAKHMIQYIPALNQVDTVLHNPSSASILSFIKIRNDFTKTNPRFGITLNKNADTMLLKWNNESTFMIGPVTKILKPTDDNKMVVDLLTELLKQNNKTAFIFGNGHSGSGKTWYLISGGGKPGIAILVANQMASPTLIVTADDVTEAGTINIADTNNNFTWNSNIYRNNVNQTLEQYINEIIDVRRSTQATLNNPQSSRGHALILLTFSNGSKLLVGDFAGEENTLDCESAEVIDKLAEVEMDESKSDAYAMQIESGFQSTLAPLLLNNPEYSGKRYNEIVNEVNDKIAKQNPDYQKMWDKLHSPKITIQLLTALINEINALQTIDFDFDCKHLDKESKDGNKTKLVTERDLLTKFIHTGYKFNQDTISQGTMTKKGLVINNDPREYPRLVLYNLIDPARRLEHLLQPLELTTRNASSAIQPKQCEIIKNLKLKSQQLLYWIVKNIGHSYMRRECDDRVVEGNFINSSVASFRNYVNYYLYHTTPAVDIMQNNVNNPCMVLQNGIYSYNYYGTIARPTAGPIETAIADILAIQNPFTAVVDKLAMYTVVNVSPNKNNPPPTKFIDTTPLLYEYNKMMEPSMNNSVFDIRILDKFQSLTLTNAVQGNPNDPNLVKTLIDSIESTNNASTPVGTLLATDAFAKLGIRQSCALESSNYNLAIGDKINIKTLYENVKQFVNR